MPGPAPGCQVEALPAAHPRGPHAHALRRKSGPSSHCRAACQAIQSQITWRVPASHVLPDPGDTQHLADGLSRPQSN